MDNLLKEQIEKIKIELNKLISDTEDSRKEIIDSVEHLSELITQSNDSWLGRWGHESYDVYNNFVENDGSRIRLTYDAILQLIQDSYGIDLDSLENKALQMLTQYAQNKTMVLTELSIIKDADDSYQKQIHLLEEIDRHTWGMSADEYIKKQRPSTMVGDIYSMNQILSRGLDTPPHIKFRGTIISIGTRLGSMKAYENTLKRLLRELELKLSLNNSLQNTIESQETILENLLNKFHIVVRQLRNRHSNRNTLEITDEYDVQDLLHGLLKINFDDIRAEDFTPTYAGRRTRVDFILKKERIVIEVKKTRSTLKDQGVGDELIQDIVRYKTHPDCDKLVCFVYDPENHIVNPVGLENDLNLLSSVDLEVKVYIRP